MKKLMFGVMMALAANAAMAGNTKYTTDESFRYSIDTEGKTAKIDGRKTDEDATPPTAVNIDEIKDSDGVAYPVTAIGKKVFQDCSTLVSVALPNVEKISAGAFSNCTALVSVLMPRVSEIGENAFWNCPGLAQVFLPLGMRDGIEGTGLSPEVVSFILPKDAQVVGENEVAVNKMELQAARAEKVRVADGFVTLGVCVCSNANCRAETKDWGKVKFTKDDLDVSEDGTQVLLRIPAAAPSGFMILRSDDAN